MPVCPECRSRDLVRFGKFNGRQKWHCNNCGLTTIHALSRMPAQRNVPRKRIKRR